MSNRLKLAIDIETLFREDLKKLHLEGISPENAFMLLLAGLSANWISYADRKDSEESKHPELNQLKNYYYPLAINAVVNNVSIPFARNVRSFLNNLFPKGSVVEAYGECSKETLKEGNCLIFYDLLDAELLNSTIRRQKVYGDFPEGLERKTPFASIVLSNIYIAEADADLVLNTTKFVEKSYSASSKYFNYLEFLPKSISDDEAMVFAEWSSFFKDINDAAPCIVTYAEDLKKALNKYETITHNLITTTLKFVSSYVLLKRFTLEPKDDLDGVKVFEATLADFQKIFSLVAEAKYPVNQLPDNSIAILNIVQRKYKQSGSFDRKDLLDATEWAPATLSDALKPLEASGILPFKCEGSSHKKTYYLADIIIPKIKKIGGAS